MEVSLKIFRMVVAIVMVFAAIHHVIEKNVELALLFMIAADLTLIRYELSK